MTNPPARLSAPNDDGDGIHVGGCSAFVLPTDQRCASAARSLVNRTLTPLGLAGDLMYDTATAVSELVTNAHEHGHVSSMSVTCPSELWIYHRLHPNNELVVRVFDPVRTWGQSLRADGASIDSTAERGRGLEIVSALFGEWSVQLTRSRLGQWAVPGKVVGFCIPIAGLCRPPMHPRLDPRRASLELCRRLTARGIRGVCGRDGTGVSLVSVSADLTVWCHRETFLWKDSGGGYQHRDLADLVDVVETVVQLHEEYNSRGQLS